MKSNRAVAYYRSASAEEGNIQKQRDLVEDYANKHNLIIVQEFVDDGYSGLATEESLKKRKAFANLNESIANTDCQCNHIIMRDISRIARDLDFVEKTCRVWKKKGLEVIFVE